MLELILLILALVCFIGGAVPVIVARINLTSLGLAFWVLTILMHQKGA